MRQFKTLFALISLFLGIFLNPFISSAQAIEEFSTSLVGSYSVKPKGITQVTQIFTLKNNVSTVYATQYALEVGSTKVRNIKVTENGKNLQAKITPQSNKTGISFAFADPIIGKDQTRTFSVSYESSDLSINTGKILEINIPKLANPTEFTSYTVNIDVDQSYGSPTVASPPQFTTYTQNGRITTTFNDELAAGGISLLFGKEQIAKLSLDYHVENPHDQRAATQIALPSDGTYQRIYYEAIEPKPTAIEQDKDGNWLATYELDPKQKITVQATLHAVITLEPHKDAMLLVKNPGSEYLKDQPYWPTKDPQIQRLANQLKTPRAIYDYVVKTLTYDVSRLDEEAKRLGAKEALTNPTHSVCIEFTDLFVTLARAAGIPARSVSGYAYTQNDHLRPLSLIRDVLHSWAEYWDETTGQWVPVDPTWENTTGGVDYFNRLDFNHIAFTTHGISSERPYPAGTYKLASAESKDIQIEFISSLPAQEPTFEVDVATPAKALFGLQSDYTLTIHNNSLHAVYSIPYTVESRQPNTTPHQNSGSLSLPPLGITQIPVQLPSPALLKPTVGTIQIRLANQLFTQDVSIKSTITNNLSFFAIAFVVAICLAIIATISWRLLVPRRKR